MLTDDKIRCRKAINRLTEKKDGEAVLITASPGLEQPMVTELNRMARGKKMVITVDMTDRGIKVTRRGVLQGSLSKYSGIDTLKPGESHTFEVLPAEMRVVRIAASQRNTTTEKRFTCTKIDATHMRVTRVDDLSAATTGRPRRRFDLSPLATMNAVRFFGYENFVAVRSAASQTMLRTGWHLYCKVAEDGRSISVYRLDNLSVVDAADDAAPAPGSAAGAAAPAPAPVV